MSTKTPRKRKPTPRQAPRRPKVDLEADRRRMDWLSEHPGLSPWYACGKWRSGEADWSTFRAAVDAAMRHEKRGGK